MARTGYLSTPLATRHDTGPGHPERAARVEVIDAALARSGLARELVQVEAPELDLARIERVHAHGYLDSAARAIASGARLLDDGDTRVSADSWRAARAAAGGAVRAVELVLAGTLDNAFVATRPPGHHAERDHAMGFCVLNNVALAAAEARARGIARVAIVDWDVHHGNGTQHLFERDPSVFYASLHQWPLYPGTGLAHERGIGAGDGTTLNCPLPPRSGDAEWLAAFDDEVLPALEEFRPELVLVSAGFDAHREDPLSQTLLSEEAYRHMTHALCALARDHAGGKLVSVLEGGYALDALARSVEAHLEELRAAS